MSIAQLRKINREQMVTDYILPSRIVWKTDGMQGAEALLSSCEAQARVGEEPVVIASTEGGKKAAIVLDFGSEFAGGVRLTTRYAKSDNGTKVRLRFGESVAEAMAPLKMKNAGNYHSVRDIEVNLQALSCSEWGQTGYRFLYIEVETPDTFLEICSIHGVFRYRDIPYQGTFVSNDELVNEIFSTSAYTVHLNMQSLVWDGIKRDRLVWIGDMHPEMLAIRTVFGDQKVVDDSLRYVAETNPIPDWPNHFATYGMWYILILKDWYMHNGRKELLEELREYWVPLLSQIAELVHEEGIALRAEEMPKGFFFDWPTRTVFEASEAGAYALCANALEAGALLCDILDERDLAIICKKKKDYLNKDSHNHCNMKQVVAMMNLAGHLSNEEAAKLLVADGGKGMSTFQSYYILKSTMQSAGVEDAINMMKEYYGGMLSVGATTFWEDFDLDWLQEGATITESLEEGAYDIHGDNGRFCYVGFRHSLCHGWSAGPAAFLAEDVLGIEILQPGCRKVRVSPNLGTLEWVKGTYPTPYGLIKVEAKRCGDDTETTVEVPNGVELV